MRTILYFLVFALIILWIIGFLVMNASSLIHILLIIAVGIILFNIIKMKQ